MKNSIGFKLGLGFAVLIALVAASGLTGLDRMSRLNEKLKNTLEQRYQIVQMTHATLENSVENARRTMQLFLIGGKGAPGPRSSWPRWPRPARSSAAPRTRSSG